MLTLIGLGLFDEKDVTIRGTEEASNADKVYLETYTSNWRGNPQNLEKMINKKIILLSRQDLEDNSEKILEEAKTKNVAVLVGGDPMVATTHSSLLSDARKNEIETKIVHNSSIISAIAETGLHIYKFGATVTIPFLEKTKGELPESVYKTIENNKKLGLHTMCLLDLSGGSMTVGEGVEILLQLENKFGRNILNKLTEAVVYSNSGDKSLVCFGTLQEILDKKISDAPSVIIIPGELHFTEKEFLASFRKA